MNTFLFVVSVLFLLSAVLLVFLAFRDFKARTAAVALPPDFEPVVPQGASPREIAACMFSYVRKGYFRQHILHNDAPEFDDARNTAECIASLESPDNVRMLQSIEGRRDE